MDLTLPIFNELIKLPGQADLVYRVFPLYRPEFSTQDLNLRRATNRLRGRLQHELNRAGRSWSHRELLNWVCSPERLDTTRVKLVLNLKHRTAKTTLTFVIFPLLNRYVAFTPRLPDVWFDLEHAGELERRATEVFESYFRKRERDEDYRVTPEGISNSRESWVSWLDVSVRTDPPTTTELRANLLALFGIGDLDGAEELARVGRNLDERYPDDLDRSLYRESEIAEVEKLLKHPVRRAILLVGTHSVGKTNLIHELVFRHVESQRRSKRKVKANFWWLSPPRLISGMMYVGQWENRVLAILDEAKKRNHVLYFDDLLSMFRIGQSRDSRLCVADLIKNVARDHSVRLLAEMTPEAYQIFSARDRGFADRFHVVRIHATSLEQTQRIAISAVQHLEMKHRCAFKLSALKSIQQFIHINPNREAMPGHLVRHLNALAVRHRGEWIVGHHVYNHFQNASGLTRLLLDRNQPMLLEHIAAGLKKRVVGQRRALDVLANYISIARSGLNEPNRPLGCLLFLGPTGVGKTETAKAAAFVLCQSPEHLIRFDLNQFKTSYSASTLVGTPAEPEGLLTSAVRQRPHAVLLFDEVEKAHPDVLDILLQVLGEARLTDSLGRTTDFSNCLIILTSNLGTQQSNRGIGFQPQNERQRYVDAAKSFFRPEFFNRIDEIIPFAELQEHEIRQIAVRLIGSIVARQGLVRRRCILVVEPEAIDATVAEGYHPELGARAMKRALEDTLAAPVAERLAALPIEATTLVRVFAESSTAHTRHLQVDVRRISRISSQRPLMAELPIEHVCQQAREFMQRIKLPPGPQGSISAGAIPPSLLRYFALDEQLDRIKELIDNAETLVAESKKNIRIDNVSLLAKRTHRRDPDHRDYYRQLSTRKDVLDYTVRSIESEVVLQRLATQIINECSLLQAMLETSDEMSVWLHLQPLQNIAESQPMCEVFGILKSELKILFEQQGYQLAEEIEDHSPSHLGWIVKISGPCLKSLTRGIVGIYEVMFVTGQLGLFQLAEMDVSRPLSTPTKREEILAEVAMFRNRLSQMPSLDSLEQPNEGTPYPWWIIQSANISKTRTDLRTGVTFKFRHDVPMWFEVIKAGLPKPAEFHVFLETESPRCPT